MKAWIVAGSFDMTVFADTEDEAKDFVTDLMDAGEITSEDMAWDCILDSPGDEDE